MSFILVPKQGDRLQLKGFIWRPLMVLMVRIGAIPEGEREERCLCHCGGYFSEQEALYASQTLKDYILADMRPEQRMLMDCTYTDAPIDYSKPISEWDEAETWNHYSVSRAVLEKFAEFCQRSGGFEVH